MTLHKTIDSSSSTDGDQAFRENRFVPDSHLVSHPQAAEKPKRVGHVRNLAGLRVGRLLVLNVDHVGDDGAARWKCRCDCGTLKIVRSSHLKHATTNSCGCLQKERLGRFLPSTKTHGEATPGRQSTEYKIYHWTKGRCENPQHTGYKYCGAKGIEFRFKSFEEFLQTMGRRPSNEHWLVRTDKEGHFEPSNLEWRPRPGRK